MIFYTFGYHDEALYWIKMDNSLYNTQMTNIVKKDSESAVGEQNTILFHIEGVAIYPAGMGGNWRA